MPARERQVKEKANGGEVFEHSPGDVECGQAGAALRDLNQRRVFQVLAPAQVQHLLKDKHINIMLYYIMQMAIRESECISLFLSPASPRARCPR